MMNRTQHLDLRVDGGRLLEHLEDLARIGADDRGGVTRPGLGQAERAARDRLAEAARKAGLHSHTDQAGNLIVRRPGGGTGRPALLMGSHLDTVINGGGLDGAYGVVAAVEVLRTLAVHRVPLRHEPVAVAFANEEGAEVPVPFWGSLALTGTLGESHLAADPSLADRLAGAGGDPGDIAGAAWPPGSIAAYLELHIEQGPVLERANVPIGIVDAIVGRTILDIDVRGLARHAGTTPIDDRRDALVGAAHVVLAVRQVGRDLAEVATVGALRVEPGVVNVVPGLVRLTAEVRAGTAGRLRAAETAIAQRAKAIAAATDMAVEVHAGTRIAPAGTAPAARRAIAAAAADLGLRHLRLPSGAGHDAQIVARVAPAGMIFVPSVGGVSHAPEEATAPEHLVAGADVLLGTALRMATPTDQPSGAIRKARSRL